MSWSQWVALACMLPLPLIALSIMVYDFVTNEPDL